MSLVEQLLEMGFPKLRAEKALKANKTATLDSLIEWLSTHQDDADIDDPIEESTVELEMDDAATANSSHSDVALEAKSLKCEDCGKTFRNTAEAEFHASKTQHVNFSESTEEKKPLTAEEKKAAADNLQKRIAVRKAEREDREEKEKVAKEKMRRKEGQTVSEIKQQMAQKEMMEIAQERKKQKEDDKAAKARILEQIQLDRENRAAAAKGEKAKTKAPTKVEPPPVRNYEECKIQLRLLDGSTAVQTFQAKEQLAAVRLFVQVNYPTDEAIALMTTFPRKVFTDEDMETPLENLGLVPSAVLVVTKKNPVA